MIQQSVIDRAVAIATKAALSGRPVERVVWLPPTTASSNPEGTFSVMHWNPSGASTPPWER